MAKAKPIYPQVKRKSFLEEHGIRTQLDLKKYRQKKLAEEEEKLDVLGQESDHKAVKWIQEEGKKNQEEEKKKKDQITQVLKDLVPKKESSYIQTLVNNMYQALTEVDWNYGWKYMSWFDGKGIRVILKHGEKNWQRAFKISYAPKYDLNAVARFAVWAEDTVAMNSTIIKPGGIILPQ